jgi:hypothetical protein
LTQHPSLTWFHIFLHTRMTISSATGSRHPQEEFRREISRPLDFLELAELAARVASLI